MHEYRSVFISDLHLGSLDCQVEHLLDFLDSVTCERLYLVGDVIDLIAMQRRVFLPESHLEVIRRVMALASNGVHVVYIPGNHDEFLRSFCGQTIAGIELRESTQHTMADGRLFHLCHGDEFDQAVRCSPLMLLVGSPLHELLVRANRWTNYWRRLRRKPYWSLAGYIKQRLGKARAFIARFEHAVLMAGRRGRVDGTICGHIHSAGFRLGEDHLYCNDGDWVEHCTALVEDYAGRLSLMHWSEHPHIVAKEPSQDTALDEEACVNYPNSPSPTRYQQKGSSPKRPIASAGLTARHHQKPGFEDGTCH